MQHIRFSRKNVANLEVSRQIFEKYTHINFHENWTGGG